MAELAPEHAGVMGQMAVLAPRLMRELGVSNGFRTVINTGPDGAQEVYHLHMHVMGGPRPWLKG
jgi:histidine triad (HIT) family protein